MRKYIDQTEIAQLRANLEAFIKTTDAVNIPQWKFDRAMAGHIIADILSFITLNEDDENDDYLVDMDVDDYRVTASLRRNP